MFKRIYKSIFNQKSRTLLLCVVLFILLLCLCFGFLMRNYASALKSYIYTNIKPKVVLNTDMNVDTWNKYIRPYSNNEQLYSNEDNVATYLRKVVEDSVSLGESEYVNYYDLNLINSSRIKLVPYDKDNETLLVQSYSKDSSVEYLQISDKYKLFSDQLKYGFGYNKLVSTNNVDTSFNYYGYDGYLVAGRYFNEDEIKDGKNVIILYGDSVVYDHKTDTYKSVVVGDTITYCLYDLNDESKTILATYDFEVVGMVSTCNRFGGDDDTALTFNLIPYNTYKRIIGECEPLIKDNLYNTFNDYIGSTLVIPTIFELKSFDCLEDFISLINDMGYSYNTDALEYISLVSSIESVHTSFNILFIFSLVSCVLILLFMILIEVNNRKKEIGILKALGESNFNICLQFSLEYLIIVLFNFLLSLIITILISGSISKKLFTFDVFSLPVEVTALSFTNILSLLGIVLLICLPGIVISLFVVLRVKVKEIMINE